MGKVDDNNDEECGRSTSPLTFSSHQTSSISHHEEEVEQEQLNNEISVSPMISSPSYLLLAARRRDGTSPIKGQQRLIKPRSESDLLLRDTSSAFASTSTASITTELSQINIPNLDHYDTFEEKSEKENFLQKSNNNTSKQSSANGGLYEKDSSSFKGNHHRQQASSIGRDREAAGSGSVNFSEIGINILYGMINATIILPVTMSFGKIIYINDAFQPYLPILIKVTLFSGLVHQFCFSTFSSLPFAIGQVQDAGLIFLSQMATTIVNYVTIYVHNHPDINNEETDAVILATSCVGLAMATCILGCCLMIIGKLKLAQYVQLLPTSVVGGYLAYIGWFCGTAGIGIMAGSAELTVPIVLKNWVLISPGILGGAFIYVLVRKIRHMMVLPICIITILSVFYITLHLTNTTIVDATNHGWIAQSETPPLWYHSWSFFKFDKVVWSVFPQLMLTELGMIFVVAISSSLDVAAIELELKEPLDYNHEIITVGFSNIVSGITGGYTGSYIFSQTIFSLRAGIRSRINGYVVALMEIIVFVMPFNVLAYVPSFFFGSLLVMICIDLLYEWLYQSYTKITDIEYIICWITFLAIQLVGVEYGIVLGGIVYAVCYKMGMDVGEVKVAPTTTHTNTTDGRGGKQERE